MKKAGWIVLLGITAVLLADCLVSYPRFAPPALRAEVVLASPGPGYVWIAGYYGWGGGRYYWGRGRWGRGRAGRAWVGGRWEQRGRNWVWRRGYWR